MFNDDANAPEAYADRIKRDLHLHDYDDAREFYTSDPAYWQNVYNPQPNNPDAKQTYVRGSAAAAGVPSRYNVFEYGFPDSVTVQPPAPRTTTVNNATPSVFDTGTSPVTAFSLSADAPRGLFGRVVDAGLIDPSNPDQPPAGGLLGLIQQSMRNGIGGPAR